MRDSGSCKSNQNNFSVKEERVRTAFKNFSCRNAVGFRRADMAEIEISLVIYGDVYIVEYNTVDWAFSLPILITSLSW